MNFYYLPLLALYILRTNASWVQNVSFYGREGIPRFRWPLFWKAKVTISQVNMHVYDDIIIWSKRGFLHKLRPPTTW